MHAAFLSSLAAWYELEQRVDRLVSVGALAVAGLAATAFLFLR